MSSVAGSVASKASRRSKVEVQQPLNKEAPAVRGILRPRGGKRRDDRGPSSFGFLSEVTMTDGKFVEVHPLIDNSTVSSIPNQKTAGSAAKEKPTGNGGDVRDFSGFYKGWMDEKTYYQRIIQPAEDELLECFVEELDIPYFGRSEFKYLFAKYREIRELQLRARSMEPLKLFRALLGRGDVDNAIKILEVVEHDALGMAYVDTEDYVIGGITDEDKDLILKNVELDSENEEECEKWIAYILFFVTPTSEWLTAKKKLQKFYFKFLTSAVQQLMLNNQLDALKRFLKWEVPKQFADSPMAKLSPIMRADRAYSLFRRNQCPNDCQGHNGKFMLLMIRMHHHEMVDICLHQGIKASTQCCSGQARELFWERDADSEHEKLLDAEDDIGESEASGKGVKRSDTDSAEEIVLKTVYEMETPLAAAVAVGAVDTVKNLLSRGENPLRCNDVAIRAGVDAIVTASTLSKEKESIFAKAIVPWTKKDGVEALALVRKKARSQLEAQAASKQQQVGGQRQRAQTLMPGASPVDYCEISLLYQAVNEEQWEAHNFITKLEFKEWDNLSSSSPNTSNTAPTGGVSDIPIQPAPALSVAASDPLDRTAVSSTLTRRIKLDTGARSSYRPSATGNAGNANASVASAASKKRRRSLFGGIPKVGNLTSTSDSASQTGSVAQTKMGSKSRLMRKAVSNALSKSGFSQSVTGNGQDKDNRSESGKSASNRSRIGSILAITAGQARLRASSTESATLIKTEDGERLIISDMNEEKCFLIVSVIDKLIKDGLDKDLSTHYRALSGMVHLIELHCLYLDPVRWLRILGGMVTALKNVKAGDRVAIIRLWRNKPFRHFLGIELDDDLEARNILSIIKTKDLRETLKLRNPKKNDLKQDNRKMQLLTHALEGSAEVNFPEIVDDLLNNGPEKDLLTQKNLLKKAITNESMEVIELLCKRMGKDQLPFGFALAVNTRAENSLRALLVCTVQMRAVDKVEDYLVSLLQGSEDEGNETLSIQTTQEGKRSPKVQGFTGFSTSVVLHHFFSNLELPRENVLNVLEKLFNSFEVFKADMVGLFIVKARKDYPDIISPEVFDLFLASKERQFTNQPDTVQIRWLQLCLDLFKMGSSSGSNSKVFDQKYSDQVLGLLELKQDYFGDSSDYSLDQSVSKTL